MPKNAELAELIGIILGDGSFYMNPKYYVYQMDIAFNSEERHIFFVKKLLKKFTDAKIYEKRERKSKGKHLRVCSKAAVINLLSNTIGKSGDKIKNQVTIPAWVWKDDECLKACIRGLMDTDGSVYRLKPHWPNLFQLSFKNFNQTLLEDTRKAFVRLGYSPSKIHEKKFVLTRQQEILKYFKDVGTNNPKSDSPVV